MLSLDFSPSFAKQHENSTIYLAISIDYPSQAGIPESCGYVIQIFGLGITRSIHICYQ